MKYLKLYNTTADLNADLANLETPYVAVSDDNLNNPVIQGYQAPAAQTCRIYISQTNGLKGIDESYAQGGSEQGLFIGGYHVDNAADFPYTVETEDVVENGYIEYYGNQYECNGYIDVPEGTVIYFYMDNSEAQHFTVKAMSLENTSEAWNEATTQDSYTTLEYTVNNDTYLYLGGDFS